MTQSPGVPTRLPLRAGATYELSCQYITHNGEVWQYHSRQFVAEGGEVWVPWEFPVPDPVVTRFEQLIETKRPPPVRVSRG